MKLETSTVAGIALVKPIGEHLDYENVEEFRRQMGEVLSAATEVVLDMSQLQFVDSSGLGAILSSLRRLSSEGGDLRLAGVNPSVAALLQLVRLDQIIGIYESSEAAVRSFQ
jgi:anti-sigma B factor antagonist